MLASMLSLGAPSSLLAGLWRTGKLAQPLCAAVAILFSALTLCAEGDLPTQVPRSKFARTASEENPYGYIYGSVVGKNLIKGGRGQVATNISFQPRYVSEIFIESVLFCGNHADMFSGIDGPVVVTFQRVAHRMVRDVPCFDLVSVDRIEPRDASLE